MSTKTYDSQNGNHLSTAALPDDAAARLPQSSPGAQLAVAASALPSAVEDHDAEPRGATMVAWVVQMVPTLLVMAALAGLGYFGHHSGWKIPKFSSLAANGGAGGVAWCDEHSVPEAECIACNAKLMPKGKLHGWCKEHGVHECVLHHPEVAQLKDGFEVSQADFDRAARALALRPRTKNSPTCKMHLRRIQFPSIATVEKAGIDIALVDRGRVVEAVSATGEIVYDPTRVARLSSRAAGTVWRVEKNVGDQVREGDVLAIVDAAEVGRAKSQLLQAVAQLDLQEKIRQRLAGLGDVVAGRRVQEAAAALAQAEAAVDRSVLALQNLGLPIVEDDVRGMTGHPLAEWLRFLGLPPSLSAGLNTRGTTANLLPVVAPRDGIVVTRDVVAGEVIDKTRLLFTVADTRRMWLMLSVPLEDANYVAVGQKIVFHADGANHSDAGVLTWISTDVDAETRTVMVRGELPNEDGHLRNETFGAGEVILREEPNAIVVPTTAVHWEGCCHVVFVRDKNFLKKGSYKVFHTRSVLPGVAMSDTTEMIAGLLPGEVVVTEGSGVLRAELLKGNLGAG